MAVNHKQHAANILLARAHQLEQQAHRTVHEPDAQRLRGRALQLRGSAWILQAQATETER